MAKLASVVWKLGIQLQQMQNAFSLVQKKRESKKKKGTWDEFWADFIVWIRMIICHSDNLKIHNIGSILG